MIAEGYHVRRAAPRDIAGLPLVERQAAALFAACLEETGLTDEMIARVNTVEHFEHARQAERLWVAVAPADDVVGFALVLDVGACAHLDELDVVPWHGRRGLGSALLSAVCSWAGEAGYPAVTLRTFRDVPWNAPFYQRRGFQVLDATRLSKEHVELEAHERRRGLRTDLRVTMTCSPPSRFHIVPRQVSDDPA